MKIAIAGLGTVGAGVIKLLADNAAEIKARTGRSFQIVGVSARDKIKDRGIDISKINWFDNPLDLVKTDADVIIEVIGGEVGTAYDLVKAALQAKKRVITANKAMLAKHGGELADLAEQNKTTLFYEAAVAGGIPVIKAVREGLAANKIKRVVGILNGTCNYILTQMEERKLGFTKILHEAQKKGYAEADPTFDIGGIDASHKLTILAAIAFGVRPNFGAVYIEGIDKVKVIDIEVAKKLGFNIKHLCIAARLGDKIEQRAHPCLVPLDYELANVDDVYNAVEIEAEPVGTQHLIGRGAGAGPTASAVVADLIDVAFNAQTPTFGVPAKNLGELKPANIEETENSYYVRLNVHDNLGVLEEITNILREQNISIRKILQDDATEAGAMIFIVTHPVRESEFNNAVSKMAKLASLKEKPQTIRIFQ